MTAPLTAHLHATRRWQVIEDLLGRFKAVVREFPPLLDGATPPHPPCAVQRNHESGRGVGGGRAATRSLHTGLRLEAGGWGRWVTLSARWLPLLTGRSSVPRISLDAPGFAQSSECPFEHPTAGRRRGSVSGKRKAEEVHPRPPTPPRRCQHAKPPLRVSQAL